MTSTAPTSPLRRRVVIVAASALAVGTISAIAPTPAIVSASATTATTAVTAAGQVAATGTVSVIRASVATPAARTAPSTARPSSAGTVAPFRFGTVRYNQWWAKRLMTTRYHWKSAAQFRCLVKLWNFESHWNHRAHNRRSGAHGIPQALPGSKMRSAGADWRTNPVTQIAWGLRYVKKRYSTPCGALAHFYRHRWY